MKNIKFALKNLFILAVLLTTFIACDKDFVSLDSDITGHNDFDTSDSIYDLIAYNLKLKPVQSNNLPSNLFGVYKDLVYGNTTANMVSQLSPLTFNPTFPDSTRLDSVVLTIPYFSKSTGIENEVTSYTLDSIYGDQPINFKLYENNYFLRSFDPSSDIGASQKYYTDRSLSASSKIPITSLQGQVLKVVDTFMPSNKEIQLKVGEETTRIAPSMRFKMDSTFWYNKIILKEGSPELSNLNNFQNYFRGIYFESEAIDNNGTMMLLNIKSTNANITMHYSSPPTVADGERVSGTYRMNFSSTNPSTGSDANAKINFLENDFTLSIPDGNDITGDEKLYLKGGEGSMAVINLFGGTDIDGNDDAPNSFEEFKNDYVETDENGKFVKAKRLVNEANLILYVDKTLTNGQEPDRIYIYDIKNKRRLIDYTVDLSDYKTNHLGRLQHEGDDATSQGIKYKIKITEHIKNLLLRDSTNVGLGLAVSTNVNVEGAINQSAILSSENDAVTTTPVSSVLSPKGTVLFGNNTSAPNQDKKLYLEIFYTEPNN